MKKLLSILMLTCLLCGMVLPAAAESSETPKSEELVIIPEIEEQTLLSESGKPAVVSGSMPTVLEEPTPDPEKPQLYIGITEGSGISYDTSLKIGEGFAQKVGFYALDAEGAYQPVTGTPYIVDGENTDVTENAFLALDGGADDCNILGKKAAETVEVNVGTGYQPVKITVVTSELKISLNNTDWSEGLEGLVTNKDTKVYLRLVGDNAVLPYSGEITVAESGLSCTKGTPPEYSLFATTMGSYTLTDDYGHTVTVKVNGLSMDSISITELNHILESEENLREYLKTQNYPNAETTTTASLRLPKEITDLGNEKIVVNVTGIKLTLTGAADSKTIVKGMEIKVPNVTLEGLNLSSGSITVDPACDLAVSNCNFTTADTAFVLKQGSDLKVSKLTLTQNTHSTRNMAVVQNPGGASVGKWLAEPGSAANTEVIDFGVTVDPVLSELGDKTEALKIDVHGAKATPVGHGWKFSFVTACDFKEDSYFTVFGGKKVVSSLDSGSITIGGQNKGIYTVVNDTYPQLVKKDGYYEMVVTANHEKYLTEVTLEKFPYAAASVTLNKKAVDTTMKVSGSSRTMTVPNLKKGTYVFTETTRTVQVAAKATTTRKYNYKYQDFYLVTPQRFTDRMRYVKEDNLITIDCVEAGRRSISLPVASMAAAAEKGYSLLLQNPKVADITMDAAALKSLAQQAKGTTILFHYRSLNHKTLSTVGQASVKSHLDLFPNDNADLAFLVTATSDSETIEDLQVGTITLKIPFIVLPGMEDVESVVYALQAEDLADARETSVADGFLTTKLTDLTEHMVFQIGEPVETTAETTEPTEETTVETTEAVPETTEAPVPEEPAKKGFPIWIPIVAVLVLGGGGAAAWFLYFGKKLKKKE